MPGPTERSSTVPCVHPPDPEPSTTGPTLRFHTQERGVTAEYKGKELWAVRYTERAAS